MSFLEVDVRTERDHDQRENDEVPAPHFQHLDAYVGPSSHPQRSPPDRRHLVAAGGGLKWTDDRVDRQ
jgi:hypothetical protein